MDGVLDALWGLKTVAMFDVWSFEHILSGVSVGSLIKNDNIRRLQGVSLPDRLRLRIDLIAVLFVAYLWETVEHYLETGLAGEKVEFWFQGVEAWTNRIISDPLLLVVGYFIAARYPSLVIPARILSVVWLVVHIFIFPHSMYLHTLF